jgi:hypothetical protein
LDSKIWNAGSKNVLIGPSNFGKWKRFDDPSGRKKKFMNQNHPSYIMMKMF